MEKFYKFLIIICPWVLLAGLLQFHFQSFLPYQGVFKGKYAFDFFTLIDAYASLVLLVYLYRRIFQKVKPLRNRLPKELAICVGLLLLAAVVQVSFQKVYSPILSDPFEYFRSLFIYPLVVAIIIYQSVNKQTFDKLVFNYVLMIGVFCVLALVQYFMAIFPGESKDFMSRLVWPYIDYLTLKTSSANWVAFFVAPGFLMAFINVLAPLAFASPKLGYAPSAHFDRKFWIHALVAALGGLTIYLVQSYGAYVGIFVALSLYLFRALKFKQFVTVFLVLMLIGVGMFLVQKNSLKYKVISHQVENYKYEDSLSTRQQIFKVNLSILKEHPFLGVGLNQYQSYFQLNEERILGKQLNESHTPPHPHNFFLGFYTNLGFLGFLAMVILLVGVFVRGKFDPKNPAIFVLVAMMVHGLIDSYYWKQEIAYNFWLVVIFAYLNYHEKK